MALKMLCNVTFSTWQLLFLIMIICMLDNRYLVDAKSKAGSRPRSPIIDIPQWGKIQGYQDQLDGKFVSVYLGIPYAKPPIGKLRFQDPVLEPTKWPGVRNAIEFGASCPQNDSVIATLFNTTNVLKRYNYTAPLKNESCLYLNIYTPINNAQDTSGLKLPVMLWIHGGGFVIGSGAQYDGGMLASRYNVIVVTINYRLGILGFFNVPGTDIKGNYGMLDQIGAMKWVKTNIRQFGGDPNKVTIFGESAGAASVALHLLSPLSKGLFIRAISQSGPPFAPWFGLKIKDATDANKFANSIGCGNAKTSLKCIKMKSVDDIVKYQTIMINAAGGVAILTATVDGRFIVDDIRKMMKEKTLKASSVPYLIGFNLDEGTMFTPFPQDKTTFEVLIKTHSQQYQNPYNARALLSFEYTNWKMTDKNPLRWYGSSSDFQGDNWFKIATVNFANYWYEAGGTAYVYKFTYRPRNLRLPLLGVAHLIDIDFVFGKAFYPSDHFGRLGFIVNSQLPYTEQDKNVTKSVMEMWLNFAKTGDPGKGWPKYTNTKKQFMNIGSEMIVEKDAVSPRRMALWNVLIPKLTNTNVPD